MAKQRQLALAALGTGALLLAGTASPVSAAPTPTSLVPATVAVEGLTPDCSAADQTAFAACLTQANTSQDSDFRIDLTADFTMSRAGTGYQPTLRTQNLTVGGLGGRRAITAAGSGFRFLDVLGGHGGTVTVSNLAVSGFTVRYAGAAIQVDSADSGLSVVDSSFSDNTAGDADSPGTAQGGAIYFLGGGDLSLTRTTLSGNQAIGANSNGGGVYAQGRGAKSVVDSTISGNRSVVAVSADPRTSQAQGGGATLMGSGPVTLRNSTFVQNTATTFGGGVVLSAATLEHVTFAKNESSMGASLFQYQGVTTARGVALLSSRGGGEHCLLAGGATLSGDYNESGDASCGLAGDHDVQNSTATLGVLADHGGPTRTMVPVVEPGSLVDRIPAEDCPVVVDQRGMERPQHDSCDVGAVEVSTRVEVSVTTSTPRVVSGGTALFDVVLRSVADVTIDELVLADVELQRCGSATFVDVDPGDEFRYSCSVPDVRSDFSVQMTATPTWRQGTPLPTRASNQVPVVVTRPPTDDGGNGGGGGSDPTGSPQPTPAPTQPPPTAPTQRAAVGVTTDRKRDRLKVRVTPRLTNGRQWSFTVQRRSGRTWKTTARRTTRGAAQQRTLDPAKGSYRVVVAAQHGYSAVTSAVVALRR